ncbi:hypothetical protein MNQ98_06315 [Paenibacillus sp. N3/727]|uniref:hypothetical protein n=1 Tax=Paenibacillus sp. N3/727 TaxID=2925845 RepID=UPI001F53BAC9|nr:hypothetical protein [Paenibacillus sp. N3/727]UNK19639.1 hypothetical protein MNQ98_06315 [Paenibacillus sp. N3/727]
MKRLLWCLLIVSMVATGCTVPEEFTRDTAEEKVLKLVPQCGNSLQTFNTITDTQQPGTGYIVTVKQNCEPENGEGPQMETIYTYLVTPDEIKLLK